MHREFSWEVFKINKEKELAKRMMIRDIERLQRQGYNINLRMNCKYKMISLLASEKDSDLKLMDIQIVNHSLA